MNLVSVYYAVEINDNGIWRKPACWMIDKKYISDRVKQLQKEGWKVRVKQVREFVEEEVIDNFGSIEGKEKENLISSAAKAIELFSEDELEMFAMLMNDSLIEDGG